MQSILTEITKGVKSWQKGAFKCNVKDGNGANTMRVSSLFQLPLFENLAEL